MGKALQFDLRRGPSSVLQCVTPGPALPVHSRRVEKYSKEYQASGNSCRATMRWWGWYNESYGFLIYKMIECPGAVERVDE